MIVYSIMNVLQTTDRGKVDEEIGAAIRESGVPRSELFITTKFWGHFAAPENVEMCLDQCLRKMGLDYVDLLLVHWPVALKPASKEALENAITGPDASNADKGMMVQPGSDDPIVDWEHTSSDLAKQAGKISCCSRELLTSTNLLIS